MTKGKERFRKFISDFYLVIILIFLYAPIFTMMVLSFNQSKSRTHWGGFTLSWYTQMFESRAIMYALYTTLVSSNDLRTGGNCYWNCNSDRYQPYETCFQKYFYEHLQHS